MSAIALDTTTSSNSAASFVSSLTWSHTCTGSNLILIVFAGHGAFNNANDDYTATYNGVSMTKFQSTTSANARIAGFYLINPATGANNVVVSVSPDAQRIVGIAHSYTGAKQSAQPDSSNVGTGSTTDWTASTTVVRNSVCWTVMGAIRSTVAFTGGTGTTLRKVDVSNLYYIGSGDSNGTVASGSQSLHLTGSASGAEYATVILSITNIPVASTLTATQASFVLTLVAAALSVGHRLVAAVATFTVTGFSTAFTAFFKWINTTKDSSSFSNLSKDASSWTNTSKDSSSFTNQAKS